MKNKIVILLLVAFIIYLCVSLENTKECNNQLSRENESLLNEKEELEENIICLINENEMVYNELKEKENLKLELFEPYKLTDKKFYLQVYKEIMLDNVDPPETIYDYTTDEEFTLLCQVVQAESGICDFDGKVNVASTIINRYFSETFPNSWKDLLLQKDNGVYQYTTIQNKSYLKQTNISEDTIEAIEYAFLFEAEVQDSTYFHSGSSNWHENNLELVYQDKWHKFYREKQKGE